MAASSGMRVRIHRGAKQIGGSCVELESDGRRLLLDLGRPLDADGGDDAALLPDVPGLKEPGDGTLLGIVISHPHQDHYGLLPHAAPHLPVFLGAAAERIVNEAAWFIPGAVPMHATRHLEHRRPLTIGPFRVTPYLVDHSAFDAYSLLVEAGGRRLFYTGDFRGSGRKAALFHALCRHPPRDIDALLMEGTQVRPPEEEQLRAPGEGTEHGVERALVKLCRETAGAVFVASSGQNIDRLVSVYRAALQAGRELVVDLYGATVAQATGNASIPQPGHRGLRVLVPQHQRVRIKSEGCFGRVDALGASRLYARELKAHPERFVVTLRANLLRELDHCEWGASQAVWSQWDGYLEEESSAKVRAFVKRHRIPLSSIHTSGHATVAELQRLVLSLAPRRVVPMHTFAPDRFGSLFPRVETHGDGEWWPA